jgi:hypothetical protein
MTGAYIVVVGVRSVLLHKGAQDRHHADKMRRLGAAVGRLQAMHTLIQQD